MSAPSPAPRVVTALVGITAVLAGVLAIVALNNATSADVMLPLAIATAAGLVALGLAARRA